MKSIILAIALFSAGLIATVIPKPENGLDSRDLRVLNPFRKECRDGSCVLGCNRKCGFSNSNAELQSCQINCSVCCGIQGRCKSCAADSYCDEVRECRLCWGNPAKCSEWSSG
ncbi:hypothetical protein BKA66DRAFT_470089 [Pyrenochaeta sp. MPI-SDFR-AT-0127]|nr:hypothetical protein BKA66DRAFT_470089 [Pyrenochaeta sp. MPI-SDFR-AT-0127]